MKHGKSASVSKPAQETGGEPEALTVSGESAELKLIRDRLERITTPDYLAANLPDSLLRCHHRSPEALAKALREPLLDFSKQYVWISFSVFLDWLDDLLRSTTDFRRVYWRLEAALNRKPFARYIQLKTSHYRIDHLLLIHSDSDDLLHHVARGVEEPEANGDEIAEMVTAIRRFLENSFCSEEDSGTFTYGEREIHIESGEKLVLAAVAGGHPPPVYEVLMREVVQKLDSKVGDEDRLQAMAKSKLPKLLRENQASDQDGNVPRWRAGLCLILVFAALSFGCFQWRRDQIYEARIEAEASDEPGIEIIGRKTFLLRKDQISILRDPMAASLVDVFASARVPESWWEINETGFLSLEEPFASFRERQASRRESEIHDQHRAEIAALYREIEKLSARTAKKEEHISLIRSEFFRKYPIQKTADLVWINGEEWELVGTAVEPYYSQIIAKEQDLIIGGGTVSLERFTRDIPPELRALRGEISQLLISYREGESRITYSGLQTRSVLMEKLTQLVMLHHSYAMPPPTIELHATPIAGVKQSQNISLASARLRAETAAIRKSPIGSKVEIATFLDDVPTPGRRGVYALMK